MATDLHRSLSPGRDLRLRRPAGARVAASSPGWFSINSIFVLSSFVVLYMSAIGFGAAKGASAKDLSSGQGDWLQQLVYVGLVLLVASATLLTASPRKLLAIPMPMVVTLAWCWLSVAWAIEPAISLRRIVLTTIIIWTVFRSVDAVDYRQPIASARAVLVITLVVNFFFALFVFSGIHHGSDESGSSLEGSWRGVTSHKNFAGAVCAFTILMFSFDTGKMKPWIKASVIVGSLFFLWKTQSKTSEAILAASMAIGIACRVYNPAYRMLALIAGAIGFAILVMFVRVYWYEITHPFFYPSDFTNRGMIWNVVFGYVKQHWLLGTGYGSFWNIGFNSPAYSYITKWQIWIAGIGSGHSGYFDLLVTIGVPGLILAVMSALLIPAYRLITSHNISPAQRALLASMLVFCAGHNLTETSLLDRDSLVNVFMLLAVALAYKMTAPLPRLRLQRLDRLPGPAAPGPVEASGASPRGVAS